MTSEHLGITVERQTRFMFPELRWAAVSSVNMRWLARSGLSALELSVLFEAMAAMKPWRPGPGANDVNLDLEAISRSYGVTIETVKRARGTLVRYRLMLSTNGGYEVNPLFAFNGQVGAQHEAVGRSMVRNGGEPIDVALPGEQPPQE
ncbi:hypothetical protein ACPC54_30825 [Kitasatospora sp. NPDC094028]